MYSTISTMRHITMSHILTSIPIIIVEYWDRDHQTHTMNRATKLLIVLCTLASCHAFAIHPAQSQPRSKTTMSSMPEGQGDDETIKVSFHIVP